MKLGIESPDLLVDVSRVLPATIDELPGGGLRIGAGVRNADVAADMRVRERYPALAQALLSGASGQLRNLATTGGNLLQRTRCSYFQRPDDAVQQARARLGLLGARRPTRATTRSSAPPSSASRPTRRTWRWRCSPSTPSCTCRGPRGAREIALADLHRLPGDAPQRDTTLEHGELITARRAAAALPIAARSAYRKVRDRASYAFALVSVAVGARARRRRHRRATCGSRSAASPTSRGARRAPRTRCVAGR